MYALLAARGESHPQLAWTPRYSHDEHITPLDLLQDQKMEFPVRLSCNNFHFGASLSISCCEMTTCSVKVPHCFSTPHGKLCCQAIRILQRRLRVHQVRVSKGSCDDIFLALQPPLVQIVGPACAQASPCFQNERYSSKFAFGACVKGRQSWHMAGHFTAGQHDITVDQPSSCFRSPAKPGNRS